MRWSRFNLTSSLTSARPPDCGNLMQFSNRVESSRVVVDSVICSGPDFSAGTSIPIRKAIFDVERLALLQA